MISLDIAEHFKTKVRPNGFKAQVVAPSRAAALRYSRFLNDFGVRAYPIITTSANDGPEFQDALGLNQDQITNAFVDPDGEPDVLGDHRHNRCTPTYHHITQVLLLLYTITPFTGRRGHAR